MPDHLFVPATLAHGDAMAPLMRKADVAEVYAAYGMNPKDTLEMAIHMSEAVTIMDPEGPVAIFGCGRYGLLSDTGSPWLLGTDRLMTKHRRLFYVWSRPAVSRMRQAFKRLENYVDARNVVSKRWLAWCGFTLHEPTPYGPFGLPFHRFSMGD